MHNKIIVFLLILILPVTMILDLKKEETQQVISEKTKINETISLIAAGDNLLHMNVVNSGKKEDGTYDFSHLFKDIQPMFSEADIAVINQETIFGGDDLGYSGYPAFNSPTDMGRTLAKEGFDVVLHATNHTLDKGANGVQNTIDFWKEYPEICVLGINESKEEQDKVKIINVKGANIALLNYTYGTNGINPPKGKEYIVNVIDEEKIEKDAAFAEENADFTIAFMHWGEEYSTTVGESQKRLAEKMCNWGVDLIIGAHPHVLQPVEWIYSDDDKSTLCYYSLGNFVSGQRDAVNLLGGIADIKLVYDGEKVTVNDFDLIPTITHYDANLKNFSVYKFENYSDEMAKNHGVKAFDGKVSVERWNEILDKILGEYAVSVSVI